MPLFNLKKAEIEISFHEDGIDFANYPYPPASIFPRGRVLLDSILEVQLRAAPPQLSTREGEILCVPALLKDELKKWAEHQAVACVYRIDVWDLLLEPFLDTEFGDDQRQRTYLSLEQCGISRDETDQIRHQVDRAMMAYNFGPCLWEWVHLGLFDVLDACLGRLSGPFNRLSASEYQDFYWKAMRLANKGTIIETNRL
jgi:hypothetical protein